MLSYIDGFRQAERRSFTWSATACERKRLGRVSTLPFAFNNMNSRY